MATTLSYTKSAFVPFTKIVSADMNTYFSDIKSRVNWAGGTDATTGLGDDNIQSIAASGGGLTRATKLKAGTAKAILVNDTNGAMSEVVPTANQTIYMNNSSTLVAGQLDSKAGGTGLNVDPTAQQAGDVLQINAGLTAFTVGSPTAVPASLKLFQFFNLS